MRRIDSVSYVKTTFGAAASLLGVDAGAPQFGRSGWQPVPADDTAWLFVEYDSPWSTSAVIGGRIGGWAGALWVLAPVGFEPISLSYKGTVDLSRLGTPVVIAPGEVPQIDELRTPQNLIVETTADAVQSVARSFDRTYAQVLDVTWLQTTASRVGSLVSMAGVPPDSPAWMFDAEGDFELRCGSENTDPLGRIRLLVLQGRSSPYLVKSADETPSPLSDFGTPAVMAPGDWPVIDRFRRTRSAFEATGTAVWSAPRAPRDAGRFPCR